MPTYEYKCPAGHVFERFFPTITDKRRVACPKCRKRAERVMSAGAGLVFKGSGFYVTDYKRAGQKGETKDKTEGESKAPESPKPKKDSSTDK